MIRDFLSGWNPKFLGITMYGLLEMQRGRRCMAGYGGPFEDKRRGDFQGLLGAHLVYLQRQTPSTVRTKRDEKLLLTLQQCKMESDSILKIPLDFTKARFPPTRKGLEY